MRVLKYFARAAVVLSLTPAAIDSAFAGSDPTGVWMNDTGRGAVEIKPCGGALCGNVVWVKSSEDSDGCGKQILGDVTPVGDGRWDHGWIYSPEKDRKYDVELTPLSDGNLKVVGYAGLKFLSKTMIWTPAPQDLQLCSQTNTNGQPDSAQAPKPTPNVDTSTRVHSVERDANATVKAGSAVDAKADANPDSKSPTTQASVTPAPSPADGKPAPSQATAKADDAKSGDNGDIAGKLGKLKIGDLELDKVITRTKSGKCKLDLPWVKVTIDCEQ